MLFKYIALWLCNQQGQLFHINNVHENKTLSVISHDLGKWRGFFRRSLLCKIVSQYRSNYALLLVIMKTVFVKITEKCWFLSISTVFWKGGPIVFVKRRKPGNVIYLFIPVHSTESLARWDAVLQYKQLVATPKNQRCNDLWNWDSHDSISNSYII